MHASSYTRDHFFLFKQKTAYEMRISDWSSDVCSSDLTSNAVPTTPCIASWSVKCSGRSEPAIPTIKRVDFCRVKAAGSLCSSPHFRTLDTCHESDRSDERRVGNGCVSTSRSRLSPSH